MKGNIQFATYRNDTVIMLEYIEESTIKLKVRVVEDTEPVVPINIEE